MKFVKSSTSPHQDSLEKSIFSDVKQKWGLKYNLLNLGQNHRPNFWKLIGALNSSNLKKKTSIRTISKNKNFTLTCNTGKEKRLLSSNCSVAKKRPEICLIMIWLSELQFGKNLSQKLAFWKAITFEKFQESSIIIFSPNRTQG